MPRTRRTQTGDRAQPMKAVPGQVYGASVEQMALARSMPAPNVQTSPTVAVGAPAVAPAGPASPSGPAGAPPLTFEQAMGAATSMRGDVGLLQAPTARPNEPVTAGLSRGPGPGRELLGLRTGTPAGDMLRRLAALTQDPSFAELADRARV